MSSPHQGSSSSMGRKRKKETSGKKRAWSHAEEQVLLGGLKKLVVDGMKSDNGFKAGYMLRLEAAILRAFPATDIRCKPHIESKLSAWKRTYAQLCDILGRSGVGFNVKGDLKIDCDNAVWDEIVRGDSSLQQWRDKPWPYFEMWKEVFGKDRATGEGAAEFADMYSDLVMDDDGPTDIPIDLDAEDPLTPPSNAPLADESLGHSASEANTGRRSHKKKIAFEECFHSLVDLVGDMQKNNAAKYEVFNKTLGKQAEVSNARSEVWSMLETIPDLSDDDMYAVGEKLLKNPECLELFMHMKVEKRAGYIRRLKDV